MQFFLYNNVSPQRILVYRSGVQDGLLQGMTCIFDLFAIQWRPIAYTG